MSLFEQFVKQAGIMLGGQTGAESAAAGQPGAQGAELGAIVEMLGRRGLGPVLQGLKDKGLGDVVASWIGTGENLPVTPDQIAHGLGPEAIENLAARLGLPPGEASVLLSKFLPQIIDKLTPHGTIEGVPTAPAA